MNPRLRLPAAILAFLLLAIGVPNATSRTKKAPLTKFWVAFPRNLEPEPPCEHQQWLDLVGKEGTAFKVFWPDGSAEAFKLSSANMKIPVDVDLVVAASEATEPKGIRVQTRGKISVAASYALRGNSCPGGSAETFTVYPEKLLGTEHVVGSYASHPSVGANQVIVVGTKDATQVTITPMAVAGTHPANTPFDVVIDSGESFTLVSSNDLSGTMVAADKPIAVVAGTSCSNVAQGHCDAVSEQVPPSSRVGQRYVLLPFADLDDAPHGDRVALVGVGATSLLQYAPAPPAGAPFTLGQGQRVEFDLSAPLEISGTSPFLAVQFEEGSECAEPFPCLGGPFMAYAPSPGSFAKSVRFATCPGAAGRVSVIVRTPEKGSVELDGVKVGSAAFAPIGSGDYSGATIELSDGAHVLKANGKFGAIAYSGGSYEGCGTTITP